MTTTLIQLIRHGETVWNLEKRYQGSLDIPLSAPGQDQAITLATAMRGESWDQIVSSPLSRALETAKVIAEAVAIPDAEIVLEARVQERGYGVAEGMTVPEREAKWPEGNWPGLEEWEDVARRGMETVTDLVRQHPGQRIVVVCHGAVINAILSVISRGEVGSGKSVILNTSRTDLTHDGETWIIGAISDMSHRGHIVSAGLPHVTPDLQK